MYNPNWHKEHAEALNTEPWKQRKEKYIQKHGHQCEHCGDTERLQLHHIDYSHEIGTEPDEDLILLCQDCHNRIHSDIYIVGVNPTFLMECCHCQTLNQKNAKVCQKCKKLL